MRRQMVPMASGIRVDDDEEDGEGKGTEPELDEGCTGNGGEYRGKEFRSPEANSVGSVP